MSNKKNEIVGDNGVAYEVKSIKMRYIKNNFYNNYMLLKEHGLIKIYKFTDGADIVLNFLTAAFNDEKVAKDLIDGDDLDANMMKEIIALTKKINEIEDEPELPNEETPKEPQ